MTTLHAITRNDGGLSLMYLAAGADRAEALLKWAAASGLVATSVRQIQPSNLPASHGRWFEALRDTGTAIEIPIARARLVRLKELVILRRDRIDGLTDQIEQAVDNGNTILAASLRAKRKSARDVDLVSALQAITDLDILDTFVPAELQ